MANHTHTPGVPLYVPFKPMATFSALQTTSVWTVWCCATPRVEVGEWHHNATWHKPKVPSSDVVGRLLCNPRGLKTLSLYICMHTFYFFRVKLCWAFFYLFIFKTYKWIYLQSMALQKIFIFMYFFYYFSSLFFFIILYNNFYLFIQIKGLFRVRGAERSSGSQWAHGGRGYGV